MIASGKSLEEYEAVAFAILGIADTICAIRDQRQPAAAFTIKGRALNGVESSRRDRGSLIDQDKFDAPRHSIDFQLQAAVPVFSIAVTDDVVASFDQCKFKVHASVVRQARLFAPCAEVFCQPPHTLERRLA